MLVSCRQSAESEEPFFSDSFEEAGWTGWENDQHCCDHSITRSQELATAGRHSLRIEVRKTDPPISRSIRAELVRPNRKPGSEEKYSFNMYLQDWKMDAAGEHVFQWHPNNLTGSASLALWTSNGRYLLQSNPGDGSGNTYYDLGPIVENTWTSWDIHIRWDDEPRGIIRLWKDAQLLVDRHGIVTTPPEGSYFKLGINKFGWAEQESFTVRRVLFFDEVNIGAAK